MEKGKQNSMKVYLELPTESRGIRRVRDALVKYAPPSVEVVQRPQDADLEIIHVIGRHDSVKARIDALRVKNKPYAMIQYCLRSTMNPKVQDWIDMWKGATLVWSYYNLAEMYVQDYRETPDQLPFHFFYAPLGVDGEVFTDMNFYADPPEFVIGASSQHALSESARECAFAAKEVGRKMFFLGHELRRGKDIVCETNLTDEELAQRYSECEFVSGLRRFEGFELPVVEGLLCGARPIVFDRPEMRHWFGEFAEFIPEESREKVIESLVKLFKKGANPVSEAEKAIARVRFNWDIIIRGFWLKV